MTMVRRSTRNHVRVYLGFWTFHDDRGQNRASCWFKPPLEGGQGGGYLTSSDSETIAPLPQRSEDAIADEGGNDRSPKGQDLKGLDSRERVIARQSPN